MGEHVEKFMHCWCLDGWYLLNVIKELWQSHYPEVSKDFHICWGSFTTGEVLFITYMPALCPFHQTHVHWIRYTKPSSEYFSQRGPRNLELRITENPPPHAIPVMRETIGISTTRSSTSVPTISCPGFVLIINPPLIHDDNLIIIITIGFIIIFTMA